MKINTQKFGTIEISKDHIIKMPDGMLGFADKKRFILIQEEEMSPFCLLQSVDDPYLGFFVIDPLLFLPDYSREMERVMKFLPWKTPKENLACFVVVTIPEGSPDKMTANLIGPVVIDQKTNQAAQMVLERSPYSHQFPLMQGHAN